MQTTAMDDDQIMKEINEGSKKESIKSVFSFHVSQKTLDATDNRGVWVDANETDNFYNFDARVNWVLERPAQ